MTDRPLLISNTELEQFSMTLHRW